jgi:hypothetical protein
MTPDQVTEWIRCRDDVAYFADAYVQLKSPHGIVQCRLNDFQRRVVDQHKTDKIFFMPSTRQAGKTTIAAILLLHQALFTDHRVSLVFARNRSLSDSILKIIVDIYEHLPDFLRSVEVSFRDKSRIVFDNMCSIISAGSNVNNGRGLSVSIIYIDESEWIDNLDEIIKTLYPQIAAISHSRIFVLSSTRTEMI